MQVLVGQKLINIRNQSVIGPGGEGLVVKAKLNGGQPVAIKIYHKPTIARAKKLEAFFAKRWNLPTDRVAVPIEPVYKEDRSLIVGLTMPFLGTGFDDVAQLSNKNTRASLGINTKLVAQIFLDGYETLKLIHSNGLVVGDLSDRNILFRGEDMLWIDVDSWQFGGFPCPVATEEYVDPNLYGIDFSKAPAFRPENDWYSFAVILFRSLLMIHPFGGVHNKIKDLKARAKAGITVFNSDVKYPKIAFSPDVLSDDLAQEFERIFKNGIRETFPEHLLTDYIDDLIECSSCHIWYPRNRKGCPTCNNRTVVVISQRATVNKGVKHIEFLRTQGNIVYTKVSDGKIYAITHENGKAILYTIDQDGNVSEQYLMDVVENVKYAIGGNILVVNSNHTQDLFLFEIGNTTNGVKLLHQTVTEIFAPNRKAVFQVTNNKVLRIIGGNILAMEKGGIGVLERSIRNGIPNQTWFMANNNYNGLQLFGLIQVLHEQKFWLHLDGKNFEPNVSNLDVGEVLLDISVKFSSDNTLLRRKTQKNGVDYLRVDIVDNNGKVTYSSKTRYEDQPIKNLHGSVYSNGVLLHATDDGIVQEKIERKEFKTFKQTDSFVGEGDTLYKFNKGIVVVNDNNISYLELT